MTALCQLLMLQKIWCKSALTVNYSVLDIRRKQCVQCCACSSKSWDCCFHFTACHTSLFEAYINKIDSYNSILCIIQVAFRTSSVWVQSLASSPSKCLINSSSLILRTSQSPWFSNWGRDCVCILLARVDHPGTAVLSFEFWFWWP